MIDLTSETVISLTEAARTLPARRRGKRPHVATLYRWSQRGCRGVRLETCQVGGTRCTSVEALQRFVNQLSKATDPSMLGLPRVRPDRDAARILDADGIC